MAVRMKMVLILIEKQPYLRQYLQQDKKLTHRLAKSLIQVYSQIKPLMTQLGLKISNSLLLQVEL
jgi:hypothetical protein